MASVFDVANWFLAHEPMPHKKLQKLCYYYKAWGLALYGTDYIPNSEFQAWIHGPVCPELYQKYKEYNDWWKDIPAVPLDDSMFTEEQKEVLESVWLTYGKWSANALEAQTHRESPWRNARVGCGEFDRSEAPILNDDMKTYYRAVYRRNQGE